MRLNTDNSTIALILCSMGFYYILLLLMTVYSTQIQYSVRYNELLVPHIAKYNNTMSKFLRTLYWEGR